MAGVLALPSWGDARRVPQVQTPPGHWAPGRGSACRGHQVQELESDGVAGTRGEEGPAAVALPLGALGFPLRAQHPYFKLCPSARVRS